MKRWSAAAREKRRVDDVSSCLCIGLLRFDGRSRVGEHGIPCTLLLSGGERCIVNCKVETELAHWARVRVSHAENEESTTGRGELVELLGPVGDHNVELLALQHHYGIRPCRYPSSDAWDLLELQNIENETVRRDVSFLDVFSVDKQETLDIDDALSFQFGNSEADCVIGIHVADVASRIACNSVLFAWSRSRAASAYNHGVGAEGGASVPMLPPELAHDELSLCQGRTRNAVSVWLHIQGASIVSRSHERTRLVNRRRMTYDAFGSDTTDPYISKAHDFLCRLSGSREPEDLIAWSMIQYNAYFGDLLSKGTVQAGLLRVQPDAANPASYTPSVSKTAFSHASLRLPSYAHCSSPIRRYSDLLNQHAIFGTLDWVAALKAEEAASVACDNAVRCGFSAIDLCNLSADDSLRLCAKTINERASTIQRYHAMVDAMELAYECHDTPTILKARVELDDDGRCLLVHTHRRRVRVPLVDTYFADPIVEHVKHYASEQCSADGSAEFDLELCGILKSGRMQLRLRLPEMQEIRHKVPEHAQQEQRTWHEEVRQVTVDKASEPLKEEEINSMLGYEIDEFQKNTLSVILQQDLDLVAMAPTGSGKTAVALMAILQAFAQGRAACYTSPIKALSNQKYAEFSAWFRGHGIDAGVSLITGDVQIRAPPETKNELIICTSEILRDKVLQASGVLDSMDSALRLARSAAENGDTQAAKAFEGHSCRVAEDPDLARIGVMVADEVHYINDVERGAVWEETLIHLPSHVQMVALSATLRNPESFAEWIGRARSRPCEIVRRLDRHVPLYIGGLDGRSGEFCEFYGTHESTTRKHGVFDTIAYDACLSLKAIAAASTKSPEREAQAQAARGERARERDALHSQHVGKGVGKGDGSPKNQSPKNQAALEGVKVNFHHECGKLALALDSADKLPAIVFCMSRRRCAEGARACSNLNLLEGNTMERDDTEAANARSEIKRRQAAMHQKHLQRFMPELGELESYREIIGLLDRGIAYHHSGMLPILREYVELCFASYLVKLVFATETLAVGVNMPARTVVFTQLDKPDGESKRHRWLRVDEFWQMAGRAGRRGLDTTGYVVYAPTLSVAGLRNCAPAHEVRRMCTAAVAPATSRLIVDRVFVLRHLSRGYGPEVLEKTLKADELRRSAEVIEKELQESSSSGNVLSQEQAQLYDELSSKLSGRRGKVSQAERKRLERERQTLVNSYPGGTKAFESALSNVGVPAALRDQIEEMGSRMRMEWDEAISWLSHSGFIEGGTDGNTLLPRGRASCVFGSGHPLIMGPVIAEGYLRNLGFHEIAAWLCLFLGRNQLDERSLAAEDADLPIPSQELNEAYDYSDRLAEPLDVTLDRSMSLLVLDWILNKDLVRVARFMDAALLGDFVKIVTRLLSYIQHLQEALLGLCEYETFNMCENYSDKLLGGLASTESLYLHMNAKG